MRLIIDPTEDTGTLTVQIGGHEFPPVSRETLFKMFFKDDYVLVSRAEYEGLTAETSTRPRLARLERRARKLHGAEPLPPLTPLTPRAAPHTAPIFNLILNALGHKALLVADIKRSIESISPGFLSKHSTAHVSGALNKLVSQGVVLRTGTPGVYTYCAARAGVPLLPPHDEAPEAPPSSKSEKLKATLSAKSQAQAAKGLCSKCDQPIYKNKKLCRKHYRAARKAVQHATDVRLGRVNGAAPATEVTTEVVQ